MRRIMIYTLITVIIKNYNYECCEIDVFDIHTLYAITIKLSCHGRMMSSNLLGNGTGASTLLVKDVRLC